MKTLSLLVASMSLLLAAPSPASIRHVGDGGGESELLLWQFTQFLPYWAQGCSTNPSFCWNREAPSADFVGAATNLKLTFVNKADLHDQCGNQQLTLAHEDLYWDHDRNSGTPEVSKSPADLALILMQTLLQCQGSASDDLRILALPQGRMVSKTGIFTIDGADSDFIFLVNSERNLHQELTAKMNCDTYKVTTVDSNGFLAQCKSKNETYLVHPRVVNGELSLDVRYNAEVDF